MIGTLNILSKRLYIKVNSDTRFGRNSINVAFQVVQDCFFHTSLDEKEYIGAF